MKYAYNKIALIQKTFIKSSEVIQYLILKKLK